MEKQGWPIAIVLMLAAGCGPGASSTHDEHAEILAIGDSYYDFHSEARASIPHVTARELGLSVLNRGVTGAVITGPFDIRSQYFARDWTWLMISGGGNDVVKECRCQDCQDNIDGMITADLAQGEVTTFLRDRVAEGRRVVYSGYFGIRPGAAFGFHACSDELDTVSERLAALADELDGLWFVDLRELVDGSDASFYEADNVHPSRKGAEQAGILLAERMRAWSQ